MSTRVMRRQRTRAGGARRNPATGPATRPAARARGKAPGPASAAEHLEAALLRRGLKRSSVRAAILGAFATCGGHVSADELTARVRETFPRVSPSTVYRTLNTLVDAGLANARTFGDGHARFEPAGSDHHDHLVCTRCQSVVEFKDDEIERLQEEAALGLGFEVTSHRLELYGVCARCRPAAGGR